MAKLRVRVQPGARRNEVVSYQAGVLKVKLTAPPIEGRANAALVEFLATEFGVRKSEVDVLLGQTSRDKVVEVRSLSEAELAARVNRWSG